MIRPSYASATIPEIQIPERRRAILVVTPYYNAHGGSTERIAAQLIAEISMRDNFHFTWAASDTDEPPDIAEQIMLPMKAFNILEKFFGLRWPVWNSISRRRLRSAMVGVDLVWLHDTLSFSSLVAFRMARKLGKPVLITQQDGSMPHPGILQRMARTALDRVFTERMLQEARQTTFASDDIADHYYRRIAFAAPVKIIPNGLDLHVFHPVLKEKRNYLRARFALRDDQPVLIFVGRFTTKNGLPVLKHLARMLPEWRFWLVGHGRINPDKWFLPNVQTFRHRTPQALAELYQSADFLILPGFDNRFPLAAQEAMACGLPVMCGTAIAGGSRFAKSHLWTCKVDAKDPLNTARLWTRKLKAARDLVPMIEPKTELAELAQSFWEAPKIAGHYADVLRSICKPESKEEAA